MLLRACVALKRLLFYTTAFVFSTSVAAQEFAVVEVILNTENKGEYFIVLTETGDVLIQRNDLATLPLRENLGDEQLLDDSEYISLRSIEGLAFEMNTENAQLHLNADATLFKGNMVNLGINQGEAIATPVVNSAFINYALNTDAINDTHSTQLSLELGGRTREIFALSTFNYIDDSNGDKLVRLMTSARTDNRTEMTTFTFGDHFVSAGSAMSSNVIIGGLNYSRNFSVAPYYTTSPALQMRGLLETPSQLEVYSNGYRINQLDLPPGEFVLDDIPAQSGLGSTEIVIRDAFGRESVISEDHYYSQILLKKGLSDYSHSIGLIRNNFGEKSFDYGDPAIASRYFQGVTDQHTLGYTLGISKQHVNLSPAINMQIARFGTLGFSVEASRSAGLNGHGATMDYSFQSRALSINASYRALTKHYANLGISPTADKPASLFNLGTGINMKRYGAVSFRYADSRYHQSADNISYGIFYNRSLNKKIHLFLNALRNETDGNVAENEFFIGLHVSFDQRHSANLGHTKRDNERVKQALFQRSLPSGNGGGYSFDIRENDTTTTWQATGQYQTSVGRYEARYYDDNDYYASAAGGIGYIDNSWFLSRPINDSFAKIKTGGLKDVSITYFGNEIVRSNENGEAIIPVVRSFHNNRIGINEKDIPLDFSVERLNQNINPEYRSGIVLDFGLTRIRAMTGIIFTDTDNGQQALEHSNLKVVLPSRTLEGLIGHGGEFYIENVPPGQHKGLVDYMGSHCSINLDIPDTDDVLLDLGELVCEM